MNIFSVNNLHLLCLVPTMLLGMVAIFRKVESGNPLGLLTNLMCLVAFTTNGLFENAALMGEHIPTWLYTTNIFLSASFIPVLYMYFCKQMGHNFMDWNFYVMLALVLFSFTPNLNMMLGSYTQEFTPIASKPLTVPPFYFQAVRDGEVVFDCPIFTLIMIVQIVLTIVPIYDLRAMMRKTNIEIPRKMRWYVSWWGVTLVALVLLISLSQDFLSKGTGLWATYSVFSLIFACIFLFSVLNMDERGMVKNNTQEVVKIDEVINEFSELANAARILLNNPDFYTKKNLVIEDATTRLGTNRTYFTRMMKAEFGATFNEYVTKLRCEHAKQLLLTLDDPMDDIAEMCGFGDGSTLTRAFKRYVNDTPDHWRREARGII